MKVDIVYTWVDMNAPGYLEAMGKYATSTVDKNPERYRDTFQLLKFSLRSVYQFFEDVQNIYIITQRPQKPAWLNIDHPKINIIHHDQIIDQSYLPTFNSSCIESHIHNIPGLSDHFIYMCDDFFFGRQVSIDTFHHQGEHIIHNTLVGENLKWRVYEGKYDIIGLGVIEHNPLFIRKSFWEEMLKLNQSDIDFTRNSRFRNSSCICFTKLYRSFMLSNRREISKPLYIWQLLGRHTFLKLLDKPLKLKRNLKKIEIKKPYYFCLNDDLGHNPSGYSIQEVKNFLQRFYPEASPYELRE